MATHTIFYSWQTDSPNSTNRGFIEECLQKALKEIKADDPLKLDPCIDRDTKSIPGTPDIASTIFEKIKKADAIVADVTFVDKPQEGVAVRRFPNPNVLVELGFAASSLDWQRVVCVFNDAFGRVEDLPFDLRHRRILSYTLRCGEEKTIARKHLVGTLKSAVESILDIRTEVYGMFLSTLLEQLIGVLIFGDELNERSFEHLNDVQSTFESAATSIRNLAAHDVAVEIGLVDQIIELANCLEEAARVPMSSSTVNQMTVPVTNACGIAAKIKAEKIDDNALSDESLRHVRETLRATSRKLSDLEKRSEKMQYGKWLDELQQTGSHLGYELLRIGHYNVDSIQNGLGQKLCRIGRQLHLLDLIRVYADLEGHAEIVRILRRADSNLAEIVAELEKLA